MEQTTEWVSGEGRLSAVNKAWFPRKHLAETKANGDGAHSLESLVQIKQRRQPTPQDRQEIQLGRQNKFRIFIKHKLSSALLSGS